MPARIGQDGKSGGCGGGLSGRARQRADRFPGLETGHVPLDVDVFVMDNSDSRKEGVGRTYLGVDGYAPIAAYLGGEIRLEQRLQPVLPARFDPLPNRWRRWNRVQAQRMRKPRIPAHGLGRIKLGNPLRQQRDVAQCHRAIRVATPKWKGLIEHLRQLGITSEQLIDRDQAGTCRQQRTQGLDAQGHGGHPAGAVELRGLSNKNNQLGRSSHGFRLSDVAAARDFLFILIESQLERRCSHVVGLDLLVSDSRCSAFAAELAKDWLTRFPAAPRDVQEPLITLLRAEKDCSAFVQLMEARVGAPNGLPPRVLDLWQANAYCFRPSLLKEIDHGPDFIWEIIECIEHDIENLPAERCAAIIEHFGHAWPPVEKPETMIGNKRPWDASHFMLTCIRRISNDASAKTAELLEDLREKLKSTRYLVPLSNAAEAQKRIWRDAEYRASDFVVVKSVLANNVPLTVSDLKLRLIDLLCEIQNQIVRSDSNGWEAFWTDEEPRIENYCRDRLIEWLRQRLSCVQFFPELPALNQIRVDIYAFIGGKGLPVEIKGQWHKDVWNAASTQLDEKYCIDWRTDRQGIYLVLWFGQTASKKLRTAPPGIKTPTNAEELRTALIEGLPIDARERIEVFVLDVSRPPSKLNAKGNKRPKSKSKSPEAD